MQKQLLDWLSGQKSTIDSVIYQAANMYYKYHSTTLGFQNLDYDIGVTTVESFNLGKGGDLCYDRPTIGYTYSLWYHARRVNTFLMYFLQELLAADPRENLDIFDLGAGTGAVQWAVGLVYAGMKACNRPVPTITIINVDSSPFMLEYNRTFLWQKFLIAYPDCREIACSFNVNSWSTPAEGSGARAWVVSSYLFDHVENKEFLADGFQALVRLYKPDRVMMLTSAQQAKKEQLALVSEAIKAVGYQVAPYQAAKPLFTGALPLVTQVRRALRTKKGLPIPNYEVSWDDHSFTAVALCRVQAGLGFEKETTESIRALHLYLAPLVVRRDIELNDQQRRAARHSNRPAIISGPAGCGKSVVITERIKNLVQERKYDPNLQILLTSFNKQLIATLYGWLKELLDEKHCTPTMDGFRFKGSTKRNITCLWFDVLPTRLGLLKGTIEMNDWHTTMMQAAIKKVSKDNESQTLHRHAKVLNTEFLLEEFHRVYYGLGYDEGDQYLTQPRPGRGTNPQINAGKLRRQLVWECFQHYLGSLKVADSFTSKRLHFLRTLRQGNIPMIYEYIFVDEFQDCTPADFEIFQHLLQNPDHLVLAGDLAQSVQIGRSSAAKIPRLENMIQRRKPYRLQGSYRLPFRISEAIKAMSEHINGMYEGNSSAGVISPYKGSPPGARPLLVYAENLSQLADKISEIIRQYAGYNLQDVTILEKDTLLEKAIAERLNGLLPVDTDTILRLKGLEKTCVIWSTGAGIEHRGEVFEFVYTILTRTSSILIITLTPETKEMYLSVLQQLWAERIICWDLDSQIQFTKLKTQVVEAEVELDNEE